MTIGKWLEIARRRIDALDAELILLEVLRNMMPEGVDRSYIFAHPEVEIVQETQEKVEEMIARREQGEPLAYILGHREFYGREYEVSPEVLIPRPETENLVNLALEVVEGAQSDDMVKRPLEGGLSAEGRSRASEWRILEIGTGSGCIATTLSLEMAIRGVSRASEAVTATDVSETALAQAKANAERLGAKVRFLRSDLLAGVPDVEKYDILVANLPYVDREWEWLDRKGLDFEPSLALYAEERGLALYRRLLEELAGRVQWVILEADPCQQEELIKIAGRNGYEVDKVEGFGVRLRKSKH